MDNISNKKSMATGFSLYYLSSALLAISLIFTNWIGGLIFSAAWLINYYLWKLLNDELIQLPNLDGSSLVPLLLKRFNMGNVLLTFWAALLVIFQIIWAAQSWLLYPLALLAFIPAFWSLKIARRLRGMVEDLPLTFKNLVALEHLSQLDTLILDEITTGKVLVEDILLADGIKEELFGKIIGTFLQAIHTKNEIISGLNQRFKYAKTYPVKNIIPFSKDRSWSSMYLESIGTVFLGPAETLLKETPDFVIHSLAEGNRIMALAVTQEEHDGQILPDTLFTIALIVLSDPLKEGIPQLLQSLQEENIQLKILTREDPVRLANLCQSLGLLNESQCEGIFGELDLHQKQEAIEYFSTQQITAYVGEQQIENGCRIGSHPSNHPDILLKDNLVELAEALTNEIKEVHHFLF